jgi:hypothetical protein
VEEITLYVLGGEYKNKHHHHPESHGVNDTPLGHCPQQGNGQGKQAVPASLKSAGNGRSSARVGRSPTIRPSFVYPRLQLFCGTWTLPKYASQVQAQRDADGGHRFASSEASWVTRSPMSTMPGQLATCCERSSYWTTYPS